MRAPKLAGLVGAFAAALSFVGGCATEHDEAPPPGAAEGARAETWLSTTRARFPGVVGGGSSAATSVRVALPRVASGVMELEDTRSGVAVGVAMPGLAASPRSDVDGVAVYAGAGYAVRPLSYGVEDFLALPSPPPGEEVVYSLDVRRAPGLRAVGFGLEVLDAGGAPRLRMEPPYVVGARGERVAARFDVRGCAVDTSPAPPWGRPVVRPGADVCTMHVRWEGVSYPALLDPKWLGSSSQVSRIGHVALRLASGRVVFGYGESCDSQACRSVPGVHLYDPVTDSIANMGGADERGAGRSGVELPNGKVLTLGGTPELFDPSNGQYTTTGPMGTPHSGAQLVRLASGKILVVGGGVAASSLYDAATNTFSPGPAMTTARTGHTATLLGNGKVLVTGGNTASAELYDPATGATGAFTATGSMTTARTGHVAVLLPNGKVLVVGGATASAELYDPATGQFSATGSMIEPRPGLDATLMPSGYVYVTGGFAAGIGTALVEKYDIATGRFATAPALDFGRANHKAVLVNGGVLVVSGGHGREDRRGNGVDAIERLGVNAPGAACVGNDDCSSGVCDLGICCQGPCTGACRACVAGTGACEPVRSADDADTCARASTCDASGACKKKDGQTCGTGGECASGHCVDGVCCNSACSGACEACDGAVKGRCDVVAGRPRGNRPCASDGSSCGGACDGVRREVCRFPSPQVGCGTACKDGVRTPSACDGAGACKVLAAEACPGNYACADAATCKTTCAVDGDCRSLFACKAGKCEPSAKCDGAHAIVAPDGKTATECLPYRCEEGTNQCRTACRDVADCAAPFVCSGDGQCIAPPAPPGGCTTSPGGPEGATLVFATAVVASSIRRRRRVAHKA